MYGGKTCSKGDRVLKKVRGAGCNFKRKGTVDLAGRRPAGGESASHLLAEGAASEAEGMRPGPCRVCKD